MDGRGVARFPTGEVEADDALALELLREAGQGERFGGRMMAECADDEPARDPERFPAVGGTRARIVCYRREQVVFMQGDPAEAIFYIRAGVVKLTLGGKLLSTVSTAFALVALPKLLVTTTR